MARQVSAKAPRRLTWRSCSSRAREMPPRPWRCRCRRPPRGPGASPRGWPRARRWWAGARTGSTLSGGAVVVEQAKQPGRIRVGGQFLHGVGVEGEPAVVTELVGCSSTQAMSCTGMGRYGVPCAQQCRQTVRQPTASMHRYIPVTALPSSPRRKASVSAASAHLPAVRPGRPAISSSLPIASAAVRPVPQRAPRSLESMAVDFGRWSR
jgi:hypothetical protein